MRAFTDDEKRAWLDTLDKRVSSATLALFNEHEQVLVVKAAYKTYWTFPGGVVDLGETPLQAAVRETREEVGLHLDGKDLQFSMVLDRKILEEHTYQFVFEQQVSSSLLESVAIDQHEIEDWALVKRDDIVMAGEREYSQTAVDWANGRTGYREHGLGVVED